MSTGKVLSKRLKRAGIAFSVAGALALAASVTTYSASQAPTVAITDSGWHHHLHHSSWGQAQVAAAAVTANYHRPPPRPEPSPTWSAPSTPAPATTSATAPAAVPTSTIPTTPATASSATGSGAPLPAALAGHPLVAAWTPSVLTSAPWTAAPNDPGGCQPNPSGVTLAGGNAVLTTTGNDCVDVQSPAEVPTRPGYVYETRMLVSNANNWASFWMYGDQWPQDGEIDAVEFNFAQSYVTWHQAGNQTAGVGSWNGTVVKPQSANFTAGTWHTVDIAFTATGLAVYYDGSLYVTIPESVTTAGTDPMWLTLSTSGCQSGGNNECASGAGNQPGTLQAQYVKEFS